MKFGISSVYRDTRLRFYRSKLDDAAFRGDYLGNRLFANRPAPDWAVDHPPARGELLRILDVNSGPVTAVGSAHETIPIEVVATDDLANEYDKLWNTYGLTPLIRPVPCSPEDVLTLFGPASFHVIYSYNGLHYTKDPVPVYRQLLQCLKPGGKIITFHEIPASMELFHHERARYFHWVEDGRVKIRITDFKRDLADALPCADLAWRLDDQLLRLELTHRDELRPPATPAPLTEGEVPELPLLNSMHLPKTGGSSFRTFLQGLYGESLQLLYEDEATHPDKVGAFQLNPSTRCVHGHFQADAYDAHLPGALRITWVRSPVERVVSSYFQYLRTPQSEFSSDFAKRFFREGWSLLDFARSEEIRRHIRWCFNAVPLDDFFFIGVTERFNESLKLICRLLNQPVPQDSIMVNINPEKTLGGRYILTDETRKELEALYAEDLNLYQYINYRLDWQLNALS